MFILYLLFLIVINCLTIYILFHTISYVLTTLTSLKKRQLISRNKYIMNDYLNNLIVIVYCHKKEKAAAYMLEMLNKQNYSKMNCQFHFILDNCNDNTANMLEFIGGAKLWKIGDGYTLGKDESISWLLERLIHVKNTDAFVFLDVERKIDENFLASLNKSLLSNDVVVGETDIIPEDASLFSTLICALNNYKNRILNTGRTLLGLISWVDIDCFAIKQFIIEKIKYVDFKNPLSSYKYTLLLAKKNYFCYFDPNIKSKISISQFMDTKEPFSSRFGLFVKCLGLFWKCNFKFNELSCFMIMPSALATIIILVLLYLYSSYYVFWNEFPIVQICIGVLFITSIVSLFITKFSVKENLLLIFSAIIQPIFKLLNSSVILKVKRIIKGEKNVPVIKTVSREVLVTDGRNNLVCELELINEDGMSKAVLKFKRKKYSSEFYLRMCDAVNDIVSTLNEHGFRVKICASCGYFTSLIDGTTNMIKGTCSKCVIDNVSNEPSEVLIWNGCENYIPQEVNKVIDISSFRTKN